MPEDPESNPNMSQEQEQSKREYVDPFAPHKGFKSEDKSIVGKPEILSPSEISFQQALSKYNEIKSKDEVTEEEEKQLQKYKDRYEHLVKEAHRQGTLDRTLNRIIRYEKDLDHLRDLSEAGNLGPIHILNYIDRLNEAIDRAEEATAEEEDLNDFRGVNEYVAVRNYEHLIDQARNMDISTPEGTGQSALSSEMVDLQREQLEIQKNQLQAQAHQAEAQIDYLKLASGSYEKFINTIKNQTAIDLNVWDRENPPWFNGLERENEKDIVRMMIATSFAAGKKRALGNLDAALKPGSVEGIEIEIGGEALSEMWNEMPGFRVAGVTMMNDLFELSNPDYELAERYSGSRDEIREKMERQRHLVMSEKGLLIFGQDRVVGQKYGLDGLGKKDWETISQLDEKVWGEVVNEYRRFLRQHAGELDQQEDDFFDGIANKYFLSEEVKQDNKKTKDTANKIKDTVNKVLYVGKARTPREVSLRELISRSKHVLRVTEPIFEELSEITGDYEDMSFDLYMRHLNKRLVEYLSSEENPGGLTESEDAAFYKKVPPKAAADAAISAWWNMMYMGGAIESADEKRNLLVGPEVVTAGLRTFYQPLDHVMFKMVKELPGDIEEEWGGPLGNLYRDRITHSPDFRRKISSGEIRYFPKRMMYSLFDYWQFAKGDHRGESFAKAVLEEEKVAVHRGLVDLKDPESLDPSKLRDGDGKLWWRYSARADSARKVYELLAGKMDMRGFTPETYVTSVAGILNQEPWMENIYSDIDLHTAAAALIVLPRMGSEDFMFGTDELLLPDGILDESYDNSVSDVLVKGFSSLKLSESERVHIFDELNAVNMYQRFGFEKAMKEKFKRGLIRRQAYKNIRENY